MRNTAKQSRARQSKAECCFSRMVPTLAHKLHACFGLPAMELPWQPRWQHGSPSSAAQPVLASEGAARPSYLPGGAEQPVITQLSDDTLYSDAAQSAAARRRMLKMKNRKPSRTESDADDEESQADPVARRPRIDFSVIQHNIDTFESALLQLHLQTQSLRAHLTIIRRQLEQIKQEQDREQFKQREHEAVWCTFDSDELLGMCSD